MELSAEVPENGVLPPFISLANDMASENELVEEASGWSGKEVVKCHALLPQALCQASGVELGADDVEVAAEKHLLSHGNQVADPDVDGVDICLAELGPCLVSGGRAVNTDENEGRELQDHATALGIECLFVNGVRELARGRVPANLLVCREIPELGRRVWWTENAGDAFFCTDGAALGGPGVDGYARVSFSMH
jgi:hypothetical protein